MRPNWTPFRVATPPTGPSTPYVPLPEIDDWLFASSEESPYVATGRDVLKRAFADGVRVLARVQTNRRNAKMRELDRKLAKAGGKVSELYWRARAAQVAA